MPELPEVETIRRDLAGLLVGHTIAAVRILDPRAVQGFGPNGSPRRSVDPRAFAERLAGRRVTEVRRRGKYLAIALSDGFLLVHLRMTGQLIWGPPSPRARAIVEFRGVPAVLNYCDTRRFGELWTVDRLEDDPALAALGPEPLADFDVNAWGRALRRSDARVQAALLDQRRIAGLGNIYVTEALFLTGVRPTRRCGRLAPAEIPPLVRNIRRVLSTGIRRRGVSFRDYRDARGERGQARATLNVYGKAGRPCPRCRSPLRGVKVNGRGTVYCGRCQR
ncbi:MAG TPA: bifunctional DNA-formamidopyrimidine glycosylase/DNA-(apurinic or apyrimidinic site) lyase [Elusimicrobiota bacterium]|nr:bifunctional DNA-formamidopyrimidine glycosylase/DNA-(apurinic or apyrimidinic site) lyase [Elusimicrobiota bacterium]HND63564.1 bifunctional DNA-formamidopyrimidine glycosylase/DNA-(apurinic or apyrimidinic site) lyase [Elusimicrobiota bacterium]HNG44930.1 bifunctional DNA-formamidopyrimidine glycosylase/DNA-(apurinic or apyrimidinic site) lyase [Elusimicrobiota bacterium]